MSKILVAAGITNFVMQVKSIHNRSFIHTTFESPGVMELALKFLPTNMGAEDTWDAVITKIIMRRVLLIGIPYNYTDIDVYTLLNGLVNVMDVTLLPPKSKNSR